MADANEGILRKIWEQIASRARNIRPDDLESLARGPNDAFVKTGRNLRGVGEMVGNQAIPGVPAMAGGALQAGASLSRPAYRAAGEALLSPMPQELMRVVAPEPLEAAVEPLMNTLGSALYTAGREDLPTAAEPESLPRRRMPAPELLPSHGSAPTPAPLELLPSHGPTTPTIQSGPAPDNYETNPEGYMERLNAASPSGQALRIHEERDPNSPTEVEIAATGGLSPATMQYIDRMRAQGVNPNISRGGGVGDAAYRAQKRGQTGGFSPSAMPPDVSGMSPEEYNAAYRMESPAIQRLMEQEWDRLRQMEATQEAIAGQGARNESALATAERDRALAESARAEAATVQTPRQAMLDLVHTEQDLIELTKSRQEVQNIANLMIEERTKETGQAPSPDEVRMIEEQAAQQYIYGEQEPGTPRTGLIERMRQLDPTLAGQILRGSGMFGG